MPNPLSNDFRIEARRDVLYTSRVTFFGLYGRGNHRPWSNGYLGYGSF